MNNWEYLGDCLQQLLPSLHMTCIYSHTYTSSGDSLHSRTPSLHCRRYATTPHLPLEMFHQDQHHQFQLPNVHHQQHHHDHQGQEWVRYLHLSPTYCSSQPNDPLLMTGSGTSSNDELVREAEHESSLRWTRKTVASDEPAAGRPGRVSRTPHHDSSSSSSPGGVIRFCSDCSTTKTPLWRSGPQGPKVVVDPMKLLSHLHFCFVLIFRSFHGGLTCSLFVMPAG